MSSASPTAPARILVIDDDHGLGEALRGLFEHAGYRVRHAATSATALAAARHDTPDLAVVDVRLGAESGLALLPALRALKPDIALIVLTAVTSAETMSEALGGGADAFACKSIDPPHLLELVASGLRARHGIR